MRVSLAVCGDGKTAVLIETLFLVPMYVGHLVTFFQRKIMRSCYCLIRRAVFEKGETLAEYWEYVDRILIGQMTKP